MGIESTKMDFVVFLSLYSFHCLLVISSSRSFNYLKILHLLVLRILRAIENLGMYMCIQCNLVVNKCDALFAHCSRHFYSSYYIVLQYCTPVYSSSGMGVLSPL